MRTAARLSVLLLPALLGLPVGCSSTPDADEQALEDIRNTTIIPNLGSYDDQVQRDSVQRMLNILERAPDVGTNLLAAALRDPVNDERVKVVCAWLLSTKKDRRALPALMEYLGEGTNQTESLVREAVVSYGAGVVPAVSEVLADGNDLARIAAAEVLIELGSREAFEALESRFLDEPEARVRFLILCGLVSEGRTESIPVLEGALTDPDPANREFAWDALCRLLSIPDTLRFEPNAATAVRRGQIEAYQIWRASRRS